MNGWVIWNGLFGIDSWNGVMGMALYGKAAGGGINIKTNIAIHQSYMLKYTNILLF